MPKEKWKRDILSTEVLVSYWVGLTSVITRTVSAPISCCNITDKINQLQTWDYLIKMSHFDKFRQYEYWIPFSSHIECNPLDVGSICQISYLFIHAWRALQQSNCFSSFTDECPLETVQPEVTGVKSIVDDSDKLHSEHGYSHVSSEDFSKTNELSIRISRSNAHKQFASFYVLCSLAVIFCSYSILLARWYLRRC